MLILIYKFEEKHVTNQEDRVLQSPPKKLPRTEGGPGHGPGGPGPLGDGGLILSFVSYQAQVKMTQTSTQVFTYAIDILISLSLCHT